MNKPALTLADFPLQSYDKLRYGDTDRQGHVNNAVFATLLETGRVELIFSHEGALQDEGCDFVIASLKLDYLREVTWPGRVDIGTRVTAMGRSSITLDQALFQDGECAATATTIIVQMNTATRRSQPLGEAARARLQKLLPAQD